MEGEVIAPLGIRQMGVGRNQYSKITFFTTGSLGEIITKM
jgi:hypothetical protein